MNGSLPKVLVVSTNAWRDNTGINTLIQFFKCWDNSRIAQIYTKASLPKTTVCHRFFRISESAVVKSLFSPRIKTGTVVTNEDLITEAEALASSNEKKLYSHGGKTFSGVLSFCREIIWKCGRWKTKELQAFIDDFEADILFIPVYPTIYMGRIQKYIIETTKKPIISYLADDNYSFQSVSKNPLSLLLRWRLRKYVRFIIEHSSEVLVIAPKQKEEYDRLFKTDCGILTKGIDFSAIPYEEKPINQPIKLVYTGKLIIGRWKSLAAIADALGEINKDGAKAELDIYTTDALSEKQKLSLNRNGCAVKGALTLEQVQKVQQDADILVFVESLEKKHRYAARLSFSTKITDYLKNGKCIFAIGDRGIAPIDYFNRYDAAITASTYEEIGQQLTKLIDCPEQITEYSKKAYECGKEHHSIEKMDKVLRDAICSCVK